MSQVVFVKIYAPSPSLYGYAGIALFIYIFKTNNGKNFCLKMFSEKNS